MITGKNSAKLGFTWYGISILKLITGISTISYIDRYPILGVIGIIALGCFVYEQIKKYKDLSK